MTILVGTASWTDPSLIKCGRFYPRGTSSAEARLRYYASQFPVVEVDSSYYAMPTPQNSQLWAERTPPNFAMNVKAFRIFTGHHTSLAALPKDIQQVLGPQAKQVLYYRDLAPEIREELWRRFIEALAPLKVAGKLVAVHFQFAPWIVNSRDGKALVEHCADKMAGHTVAVEFRNRTWFEGKNETSTIAWERELGLVNVIVDEPQGFPNSIPSVWKVTSPHLAIVRLHGRNIEAWNATGHASSGGRFCYEYTDAELESLASNIRMLNDVAASVHTVLNTNYEDQGQRNGRRLIKVLETLQ